MLHRSLTHFLIVQGKFPAPLLIYKKFVRTLNRRGGGRNLQNLRPSPYNDDLSNDTIFRQIHLDGHYLQNHSQLSYKIWWHFVPEIRGSVFHVNQNEGPNCVLIRYLIKLNEIVRLLFFYECLYAIHNLTISDFSFSTFWKDFRRIFMLSYLKYALHVQYSMYYVQYLSLLKREKISIFIFLWALIIVCVEPIAYCICGEMSTLKAHCNMYNLCILVNGKCASNECFCHIQISCQAGGGKGAASNSESSNSGSSNSGNANSGNSNSGGSTSGSSNSGSGSGQSGGNENKGGSGKSSGNGR